MRILNPVAVLILTAMTLSGLAAGQQPPAPPGPDPAAKAQPPRPEARDGMDDKDLRELVETVKMVRLSRELGLNDEQTVTMIRKYERYRDELAQLKRERQQKMRSLKEVVRAGKPDADIDLMLQDLRALDQKVIDIRNQAYDDAATGLDAKQRAKLYVFLNEFEEDMRRLVQKAQQAGGGRLMRMRELRDNAMGRPEGPPPEGPEHPRPPLGRRDREAPMPPPGPQPPLQQP